MSAFFQADLVGVSFGEIMLRFADAVPLGIKTNGRVVINPPDSTLLQDGDEVVVLAEDDDTYSAADAPFPCSEEAAPSPAASRDQAEEILFCGWRRDMHYIILALDNMVPSGSTLHIMSDKKVASDDPEEEPGMADILSEFLHGSCLQESYEEAGTPRSTDDLGMELPTLAHLRLNFIQGSHTARKELEKLPLETYNSVLILASEESEEIHDMETTDSESLACLLRIRDIVNRRYQDKGVAESARPRQELISEILDSRTKELVQMMKISEYVMSNALISCALAM